MLVLIKLTNASAQMAISLLIQGWDLRPLAFSTSRALFAAEEVRDMEINDNWLLHMRKKTLTQNLRVSGYWQADPVHCRTAVYMSFDGPVPAPWSKLTILHLPNNTSQNAAKSWSKLSFTKSHKKWKKWVKLGSYLVLFNINRDNEK